MKRSKSIIWGLVLVIIGIIMGGNALELFNVTLFFDGWWTLFIIIPSIFSLASSKDKTGSLITLIIGILLLLSCQNIIDFEIVWKLLVPIIIVGIGLSLLFKNAIDKSDVKVVKNDDEVFATFSGQDIKIEEEFKGTNLNAIFGGISFDLRKAKIKSNVTINTCAIFGGIDLYVSDDVIVKVKSTSIFGGVDNKLKTSEVSDKKHVVYVNATCIFGGVDIK